MATSIAFGVQPSGGSSRNRYRRRLALRAEDRGPRGDLGAVNFVFPLETRSPARP